MLARLRPALPASARSTYPMAPEVCLINSATPEFFSAPCVDSGQLTSSPLPRVQTLGDAAVRYFVKLLVVPEPSERCTTVIAVAGNSASGLSAAILGSFHVVISAWKIPAITSGLSCSSVTPSRLNETVIGAATVGKNNTVLGKTSPSLGSESLPAKSTVPAESCERPSEEPLLA